MTTKYEQNDLSYSTRLWCAGVFVRVERIKNKKTRRKSSQSHGNRLRIGNNGDDACPLRRLEISSVIDLVDSTEFHIYNA